MITAKWINELGEIYYVEGETKEEVMQKISDLRAALNLSTENLVSVVTEDTLGLFEGYPTTNELSKETRKELQEQVEHNQRIAREPEYNN